MRRQCPGGLSNDVTHRSYYEPDGDRNRLNEAPRNSPHSRGCATHGASPFDMLAVERVTIPDSARQQFTIDGC